MLFLVWFFFRFLGLVNLILYFLCLLVLLLFFHLFLQPLLWPFLLFVSIMLMYNIIKWSIFHVLAVLFSFMLEVVEYSKVTSIKSTSIILLSVLVRSLASIASQSLEFSTDLWSFCCLDVLMML